MRQPSFPDTEPLRQFWFERLLNTYATLNNLTSDQVFKRIGIGIWQCRVRTPGIDVYRRLAVFLPHKANLIGLIAVAPREVLEKIKEEDVSW